MKKLFTIALIFAMILTLVACGGKNNTGNNAGGADTEEKVEEEVQVPETPDLQVYFDEFIKSLGADNTPAMINMNDDAAFVDTFLPGLNDVELKQSVLQMAAMDQVGFELDLVECANAEDVETVKTIFQARVDSKIEGGAFYPAVAECWENAEIIANGNVVALIVAG